MEHKLPFIIETMTQTCSFCPSQWEGHTTCGKAFYIRYRWGTLAVSIGDTVDDAVLGETIFHEKIGDAFDGALEEGELFERLQSILEKKPSEIFEKNDNFLENS